jgi:hypothetical protein
MLTKRRAGHIHQPPLSQERRKPIPAGFYGAFSSQGIPRSVPPRRRRQCDAIAVRHGRTLLPGPERTAGQFEEASVKDGAIGRPDEHLVPANRHPNGTFRIGDDPEIRKLAPQRSEVGARWPGSRARECSRPPPDGLGERDPLGKAALRVTEDSQLPLGHGLHLVQAPVEELVVAQPPELLRDEPIVQSLAMPTGHE